MRGGIPRREPACQPPGASREPTFGVSRGGSISLASGGLGSLIGWMSGSRGGPPSVGEVARDPVVGLGCFTPVTLASCESGVDPLSPIV